MSSTSTERVYSVMRGYKNFMSLLTPCVAPIEHYFVWLARNTLSKVKLWSILFFGDN